MYCSTIDLSRIYVLRHPGRFVGKEKRLFNYQRCSSFYIFLPFFQGVGGDCRFFFTVLDIDTNILG